jgi:hypothetical protein
MATFLSRHSRFLAGVDPQDFISVIGCLLFAHGLLAPLCLRVFFRDERACARVATRMERTFKWEPGEGTYPVGNKKPATARAVRVLDSYVRSDQLRTTPSRTEACMHMHMAMQGRLEAAIDTNCFMGANIPDGQELVKSAA